MPILRDNTDIRPVGVFREPMRCHPGLDPGVRRTLGRRIRDWRACHGPAREVIFRQAAMSGRIGLSDFTSMNTPDIVVAGQPFDHRLCHFRFLWLGFCHAEVVLGGESFTALATGMQAALRSLGGVPAEHRNDSLSVAFRNLDRDDSRDRTERYGALCGCCWMTVSRNNRGVAYENGAIESAHGHPKCGVVDALALWRSRDFADIETYSAFIAETVGRGNARLSGRIKAEREKLRDLPPMRATDYGETGVDVTSSSGFILKRVFHTVPWRLIGHRLGVRLCDDRLELHVGTVHHLALPRKHRSASTKAVHVVNHRHVIHSLKTKPMVLMNLIYRDMLFPRDACRRCFETAVARLGERAGCRLTVKLPALAHEENCEAALAAEIDGRLVAGKLPDPDDPKARFTPESGAMPGVHVIRAPLAGYGDPLGAGGAS